MKTIYCFSLLVFLGLMTACQKDQVSIAGGYDLEIGHTVSFENRVFEIHFDRVVTDSRCPIGSNCEDLGQAIIELVITNDSGENSYQFTSDDPACKTKEVDTAFGKYEIEFIDLYPYPVLNQPLEELQSIVITLKKT